MWERIRLNDEGAGCLRRDDTDQVGIVPDEFLEDWNFPFHLANSIKYICRAGRKDPTKTVEDLQKAVWYINRYIGFIGRQAENVEKSGGCDED